MQNSNTTKQPLQKRILDFSKDPHHKLHYISEKVRKVEFQENDEYCDQHDFDFNDDENYQQIWWFSQIESKFAQQSPQSIRDVIELHTI